MAHADGLNRGGSHERGEENVSSFLGFRILVFLCSPH